MTGAAARPEIRWIRDSGRTSTGPNFEKSCAGISGIPAAAGTAGLGTPGPVPGPRTIASRSSLVMRPFGPVPVTVAKSTPSSRASLRTPGPACAAPKSAGGAAAGGTGADGAGASWAVSAERRAGSCLPATGSGASWPGGSC